MGFNNTLKEKGPYPKIGALNRGFKEILELLSKDMCSQYFLLAKHGQG